MITRPVNAVIITMSRQMMPLYRKDLFASLECFDPKHLCQ